MASLLHGALAWPVAAILYLALQPAWDHLAAWAARWRGRPRACVAALQREPQGTCLRTAGTLLYALGIPYAALLLGIADARRLGLAGLAWWPQLPLGGLVALGGMGLLAWTWGHTSAAAYRRGSRQRLLFEEWQAFRVPWGWADLAFDVLCLQATWAFVRGAAIRAFGLYGGVFAGLVLLAAVWLLRPGRSATLADPEKRARALLTAGLAVVTGLVFLRGENLWLCVLVHGVGLFGAVTAAGRVYARAEG